MALQKSQPSVGCALPASRRSEREPIRNPQPSVGMTQATLRSGTYIHDLDAMLQRHMLTICSPSIASTARHSARLQYNYGLLDA